MPRIKLLKILIVVALAIITVRLFFIQIIEHGKWVEKAAETHTLLDTITAERGKIYMMDEGKPVAVVMNQTVYTIVIDPAVTEKEKISAALNELAPDKMRDGLEEAYKKEGLRYFIVASGVEKATADKIAERGILGVRFVKQNQRFYPEGELAAGLLGFVNAEGKGQYGVEGALNEKLAGKDGLLKTVADVNKVALSIGNDNVRTPAVDGEEVVLTIERGLERQIEEILAVKVANSAATHAAAVVMNPENGEVLAMANVPTYDPGNYGAVKDAGAYVNYVTEVPYEPASVCKTFTFAAAVDKGVMTAEKTYYNEGFLVVDGARINNAYKGQLGEINIQTALNYSLNTGSIQALKWLGGDAEKINETGRRELYRYFAQQFGFGQDTGIELYEAAGVMPDPDEGWARDLTYANMTFGQGLNLTMIQTVAAFSAVVNGGNYYRPTVVVGKMEGEELVRKKGEGATRSNVVSPETSREMREMLIGTRARRRLNGIDKAGYAVGGKTGTAQVLKDGKYSDAQTGETIASYVGFGGAEGGLPEYVIMVKIWGEGAHLEGEKDALPVFDEISNFTQNYLKIQPKE